MKSALTVFPKQCSFVAISPNKKAPVNIFHHRSEFRSSPRKVFLKLVFLRAENLFIVEAFSVNLQPASLRVPTRNTHKYSERMFWGILVNIYIWY